MSEGQCPVCAGSVSASGFCFRCGRKTASARTPAAGSPGTGRQPSTPNSPRAAFAAPRSPSPLPPRSGSPAPQGSGATQHAAPLPPPVTPSATTTASAAAPRAPLPVPLTPTAPPNAPSTVSSLAAQPGLFGHLRVRGMISEVGVERHESVSLAGAEFGARLGHGLLTLIPRAIGLLLALRYAMLRFLLIPSLLGMGRRPQEPERMKVPVTPFMLTADDGTLYDCIIRGEVRGGFLKLGEQVEISGRVDRTRVVRASEVRSLRTGAITRGYVDPHARFAPVRTAITLVVVIGLITFLASVFVTSRGR